MSVITDETIIPSFDASVDATCTTKNGWVPGDFVHKRIIRLMLKTCFWFGYKGLDDDFDTMHNFDVEFGGIGIQTFRNEGTNFCWAPCSFEQSIELSNYIANRFAIRINDESVGIADLLAQKLLSYGFTCSNGQMTGRDLNIRYIFTAPADKLIMVSPQWRVEQGVRFTVLEPGMPHGEFFRHMTTRLTPVNDKVELMLVDQPLLFEGLAYERVSVVPHFYKQYAKLVGPQYERFVLTGSSKNLTGQGQIHVNFDYLYRMIEKCAKDRGITFELTVEAEFQGNKTFVPDRDAGIVACWFNLTLKYPEVALKFVEGWGRLPEIFFSGNDFSTPDFVVENCRIDDRFVQVYCIKQRHHFRPAENSLSMALNFGFISPNSCVNQLEQRLEGIIQRLCEGTFYARVSSDLDLEEIKKLK